MFQPFYRLGLLSVLLQLCTASTLSTRCHIRSLSLSPPHAFRHRNGVSAICQHCLTLQPDLTLQQRKLSDPHAVLPDGIIVTTSRATVQLRSSNRSSQARSTRFCYLHERSRQHQQLSRQTLQRQLFNGQPAPSIGNSHACTMSGRVVPQRGRHGSRSCRK